MGKKLYRVTCRGMTCGDQHHGIAYVVATDPSEAYKKVRSSLDERKLGFQKDRELDKIELLAEVGNYPECGATTTGKKQWLTLS